ncbi:MULTISPECIES: c-type cytochrome [Burkholderia]|uniref:c-type cytochrome n=1 Tax=Burkholderia TaxID=32008 RepID=UPI00119BEDE5|nr:MULTISPECIES: cytochrome c [Burkholderia]MBU9166913.1 cytochrome c [Burkholderia gladioli]MBU9384884.1 cytochrome c [Burkholderia gladioli]MDC6130356.1 cytochrome c [Burkholderia gladioli]MDN7736439.1 cytochrome c [Burkholderia gladioli]TWC76557.1 mono/diheme cytochrome c family protein [Burkholderia sp. SJZ089]
MKRQSLYAFGALAIAAAATLAPAVWPGAAKWAGSLIDTARAAAPAADTSQAALIKKGEYLSRVGDCVACHTVRGGQPFAGGLPMPTPFGTMYTPNITPDNQYGIGKWSADDFYRAMHTGRSKDGSLLYPGFPFTSYTKVTRADSDAIYAYLRSVPAVNTASRPHELKFPFNNRNLLIGWRTLFFKEGEFKPDPTKSVEWNRGAYLVEGLGHCSMCHTSINLMGAPRSSSAFAGGLIPLQNWYAPSLTNDTEFGLGDWHVQELTDLLQAGVSMRGAVFGPMADVVHNSLQYMSDDDARAMSVYLKSIPQKGSAPTNLQYEPSQKFGDQLLEQGRKLYADNCATCHGASGQGKPPSYPPLAGNHSIMMESAVNPIRMVLNGGYPPSTFRNPRPYGMPPFAQALSNQEVAAVVSYIRSAWGNNGSPISPQQVSDLRSAPLD